jgi:hypothetical protein
MRGAPFKHACHFEASPYADYLRRMAMRRAARRPLCCWSTTKRVSMAPAGLSAPILRRRNCRASMRRRAEHTIFCFYVGEFENCY